MRCPRHVNRVVRTECCRQLGALYSVLSVLVLDALVLRFPQRMARQIVYVIYTSQFVGFFKSCSIPADLFFVRSQMKIWTICSTIDPVVPRFRVRPITKTKHLDS